MRQRVIHRSPAPAALPKREYLVVPDPRTGSEPSFDDVEARACYDSAPPTFSISNPWVPLRAPPPKPRLGWRGVVLSLVTFVIGSVGSTYLDRQYGRDAPPPPESDALPAALVTDGPRTAIASPFVAPDDPSPLQVQAPSAPAASALAPAAPTSAAAPVAAQPPRGQKQSWRSRSAPPRR